MLTLNGFIKPLRVQHSRVGILIVMLSLLPHPAAAINKCVGPSGGITFSDKPCPENAKSETMRIKGQAGGGQGAGVPSQWRNYCIATFTRDLTTTDMFGKVELEIEKGSEYLLTKLTAADDIFSDQIAYLTKEGAVAFQIKAKGDRKQIKGDKRPFTSNCNPDSLKNVFSVFADVTLYADKDLSQEACRLQKGMSFDDVRSYGFGASGSLSKMVGKVSIDALSQQCGGYKELYYTFKKSKISGVEHTVSPFTIILSPR